MSTHPFDEAIRLAPQPDGTCIGHTSAAYANMVGPYGGITAAQAMQAVLQHPDLLGEPVSLTVNFCAAVADGAFEVQAWPARTNRSTQHWMIEMCQGDEVVLTGTAVTAVRRETWGVDEEPMPLCPPPSECPLPSARLPMEFLHRYEIRSVSGKLPVVWDGSGHSSLTQIWTRDQPPRPLDFASLSALADIFIPRVFIRRATLVPVGTVSMTVYFHASAAQLAATGTGYLLGQARAQAFRNGFYDQTSQLWNEAGVLLVTTQQIVYYKG
jgi:acyl-coenzyme A thioesterase PaaI-like protein